MDRPYHIPAWERPMLERIARCMTEKAREAALLKYINERERRRRYAAVRDSRDPQRRTLVGAHMARSDAEIIGKLADASGLSITAYVRQALEHEAQRSIYFKR